MGSDLTAIITRGSQSSFLYSFSFLPKDQRNALNTVYAFCRTTDDIVDSEADRDKKTIFLRKWRIELGKALRGESRFAILNQLAEVTKKFNIPTQHFYELIQGVEMDLTQTRIENFGQLKKYCYLVASTVGLMSIKIFGPTNERVEKYAENLGIALQLTNILRDIKADAKINRIYIPQEDLKRFGYTEENILNNEYNSNFINLMEFETKRAEEYYRTAQNSLQPEDKRFLFAPKIMERIYYHTLLRIKANRYNVYKKSLKLPRYLQLMIAIKYWVKLRLLKTV
ncbi:MAG: presqualene diphosphate synthase HpnD [Bacteroidota bacterium]|nr:presqualene diphosphate synthase HpnD [Bacteroidota bacterium]